MTISSTPILRAARLLSRWDWLLGILAVGVGSVSLTFPFGHDQALYEYVAREWVRHGSIPYRDVFDHKTPGIYLLHAVTVIVFGAGEWGIRVADLACVLALGLVCARLATPRDRQIPGGLRGLGMFSASVLHYGFFDYWNTAQSELWYVTLGLASVAAAGRVERETRSQLGAGALGAAAMIMKPPAVWFVLLAAFLVAHRAFAESVDREHRLRRTLLVLFRFTAGFVVPVALVLGYFGAHHALSSMADIVIGANGYYVAHDRTVQSVGEALQFVGDFFVFTHAVTITPLALVALAGICAAHRRDQVKVTRCLLPLVGFAAGLAAVAMQQKFYWVHWLVMIGPGCWLFTTVAYEALLAPGRARSWRPLLLAGALVLAYVSTAVGRHSGGSPATYAKACALAWRHVTGRISREDYDSNFTLPKLNYFYRDIDDASRWIVANSAPDDILCVRGFNPEIYILSDRRYLGRFFWTVFLTEPGRAYRREDYLAEDAAALHEARPKLVVAQTYAPAGIDSVAFFVEQGYRPAQTFGSLTVLARSYAP